MSRSKRTTKPVRHAPRGGPARPDSRRQAESARSLSHRRLGLRLRGGGLPEPPDQRLAVDLFHGDALAGLAAIPDASVDAVISDPPYPEIGRAYGRLTEPAWHDLMNGVVVEARRILKPTGSAVFILQPNFERLGRMRPWLWEFMARWSKDWGMVQDAWWWNYRAMPTAGVQRSVGLMRGSLKACVWLGPPSCYRAQERVLWEPGEWLKAAKLEDRALRRHPSGHSQRRGRVAQATIERGGATPLNVLPCGAHQERHGHPAATPIALASWWTRYLTPVGGVVCDPFTGSGTMGRAALRHGASFVGVERDDGHFDTACASIAAEAETLGLEVAP